MGKNSLFGDAGDDYLKGRSALDTLNGGTGHNTLDTPPQLLAYRASECVEDPTTPGFDCAIDGSLPGAQLTSRLDFFPGEPGRDVITTVNGVPGLVLLSRPETSPSDQGLNSKTVYLYVKNWKSNTSEPVEVLIRDATGRGRILLDFQIPNNLPNRLRVFPSEGVYRDVLIRQDPANMFTAGVSDKTEYAFSLGFSVLRGATPGITPVTLIVRQGQQEYRTRLDLVVMRELGAPIQQGPTGTTNSITPTFFWTPVDGASRYEVVVENSSRTRVLHTTGAPATNTSVQSWTANAFLTPGQSYNWWVRAIATDGSVGPWSTGQNFTVAANAGQTAPLAPTLNWQQLGGNNIRLGWTNVVGESGYVVDYWNASTRQWVRLTTLGADATSLDVTGGNGYYFRVGAFNTGGTTYSSWIFASPPAQVAPPAAPSLQWSRDTGNNIVLNWTNVVGETGYVVEYWNASTSQWVRLSSLGADVTRLSVTNGYGFYFRVGATNSSGKYSFGDWILAG